VRIDTATYRQLKAFFLERACHRSAKNLALDFYGLPFEGYAPIRRQLLTILKAVNEARQRLGYCTIPHQVLPLRRRIVRPFELSGRAPAPIVNPVQS
jgi:hypothetical protein